LKMCSFMACASPISHPSFCTSSSLFSVFLGHLCWCKGSQSPNLCSFLPIFVAHRWRGGKTGVCTCRQASSLPCSLSLGPRSLDDFSCLSSSPIHLHVQMRGAVISPSSLVSAFPVSSVSVFAWFGYLPFCVGSVCRTNAGTIHGIELLLHPGGGFLRCGIWTGILHYRDASSRVVSSSFNIVVRCIVKICFQSSSSFHSRDHSSLVGVSHKAPSLKITTMDGHLCCHG
jgi:hypothetical protein